MTNFRHHWTSQHPDKVQPGMERWVKLTTHCRQTGGNGLACIGNRSFVGGESDMQTLRDAVREWEREHTEHTFPVVGGSSS